MKWLNWLSCRLGCGLGWACETMWGGLVHLTAPVVLTKSGPLGTRVRCLAAFKRVNFQLTHFAFGNRLIPNASSCLLRIKLHKVPAVLRETWQGAWIPRGKGQFWGCPSGVLLKMEVGIRKGAWRRAWRYPAYLWSLRWVYAVKKTWRLVYGVYPHIPPNTPLVTPSDAAVRQNSITT